MLWAISIKSNWRVTTISLWRFMIDIMCANEVISRVPQCGGIWISYLNQTHEIFGYRILIKHMKLSMHLYWFSTVNFYPSAFSDSAVLSSAERPKTCGMPVDRPSAGAAFCAWMWYCIVRSPRLVMKLDTTVAPPFGENRGKIKNDSNSSDKKGKHCRYSWIQNFPNHGGKTGRRCRWGTVLPLCRRYCRRISTAMPLENMHRSIPVER